MRSGIYTAYCSCVRSSVRANLIEKGVGRGVQSGSVQFVGVGCKVGVPENWGCGYVEGVLHVVV